MFSFLIRSVSKQINGNKYIIMVTALENPLLKV